MARVTCSTVGPGVKPRRCGQHDPRSSPRRQCSGLQIVEHDGRRAPKPQGRERTAGGVAREHHHLSCCGRPGDPAGAVVCGAGVDRRHVIEHLAGGPGRITGRQRHEVRPQCERRVVDRNGRAIRHCPSEEWNLLDVASSFTDREDSETAQFSLQVPRCAAFSCRAGEAAKHGVVGQHVDAGL